MLNPTRELLVETLNGISDLSCLGPGYPPSAIVEQGIKEFVETNGPFDIVFADERVIDDYSSLAHGKPMRFRIHVCRLDPNLLRLGSDY